MDEHPAAGSLDELLALDPAGLDDDALKALLVGLGRVRARLDAVELAALGELHVRCAYVADGAVAASSWLSHHTGVAQKVAGSRLWLARRLRHLPAMAAALGAGSVTEQHARVLGRCLSPRTVAALARDEELLVAQAEELDADDFEIVVSQWLRLVDVDGPDPGPEPPSTAHASRHFRGRVQVDADLDVADGAVFLAELESLADELWRQEQAAPDGDPIKGRSQAERKGAALAEMARRSSTTHAPAVDGDGFEDRPGPAPRRPQLIVVVPLEALTGAGAASLEDGTEVPRAVLARWACDSALGRVVMGGRSQPLDLGTLTYTPSPAQRRALVARDRHCVVPGCKRRPRWCEAHHVVPWPKGPTDLSNLVLLCARHHKHVHAGVIRLEREGEDRWQVLRADATPVRQRPPPILAA